MAQPLLPAPVSAEPEFHYLTEAEQGQAAAIAEGCPSTSSQLENGAPPKADPGKLCMYEAVGQPVVNAAIAIAPPLVTVSGATVSFDLTNPEAEARGLGVWAVSE